MARPNGSIRLSRRSFLKLMSASIALAGVGACTRQPLRPIVPYVRQPEELIPGRPLFFATALTLAGYARGVLVETHEGRPTKIEGNPEHPASRGASDIFMQAEILVLYDPDRSQAVIEDGQISTWDSFLGYLSGRAQEWKTNRGAGLRVLTRHETSPTFRRPNAAAARRNIQPQNGTSTSRFRPTFQAQSIISTKPKSFSRLALISSPRVRQV